MIDAIATPAGPCLNMPASKPPTMTLPSSAQKMKNFVLSQSHGCRMIKFGTTNHSHIGANHFPNPVGNQRCKKWATMSNGMNTEVFLIQNQNQFVPSASHPRCMQ